MAEKTLKTKLKLRYDTLANWGTNDPVLLKGEVALVEVPNAVDPIHNAPTVVYKVGDGVKTFSQLNYGAALSADVYSWAKAATKPSYNAGEVGVTESAFPGLKKTGTITEVKMNGASKGTSGSVDLGKVVVGASNTQHAFIENPSADGSYVFAQDLTINASNQVEYSNFDDSISFPDMKMFNEVSDGLQSAQQDITGVKSDIITLKSGKQDKLKAGSHISIATDNTISAAWPSKNDIGLGSVANKSLDTSVTANSANYITSGAVKSYVDGKITGLTKFDIVKYDKFNLLPTTGVKGTIYIVPHAHGTNDSYDEYIWNTALTTPAYEKIGNTDVDLSGYVPTTRKVNGKPLSADIDLGAADVGVNETAFPGLKQTGTVTSVSGTDGLTGTVTKSGSISHAVPTGAAAKASGLYKVATDKFGHVIGTAAVTKADITALGIPGQDTNTVTTVSTTTNQGLKVTKSSNDYKIDIDEAITFVLDCGDSK